MHLFYPDYCREFKCLMGACPDTCCSGWQVVVDEDSQARFRKLSSPLREELEAAMEESDGEVIFAPQPNGDCPFLQHDHLCRLYPELGGEGLCFPCRTYPRIYEEFGLRREESLSLSCPEAARLILGSEAPITFLQEDTTEPLAGCNEIDAELYRELLAARTRMIALAQSRRAMPVAERAALLLLYAQALQEQIPHHAYDKMAEITVQYSDPAFLQEQREALGKYKANAMRRQKNVSAYFQLLQGMASMHEQWSDEVAHTALLLCDSAGEAALVEAQNDRFEAMFQREDYRFEHLLVYYLFRYALRSVDDNDFYGRVKFAVFSFLVIRQQLMAALSEGIPLRPSLMIELAQRYSREIEHSPGNLAVLQDAIHHQKCFEIRQMLYALLG